MTKISELGRIVASNTKSRDLFVTVSLDLGEQGTKNITRAELVKAIQQEPFNEINITGGSATNLLIQDPNFEITEDFESPIADEDFLLLKDVSSNTVVAFSYADLTNEFANTFRKANKIYVANDGFDANTANGSYFKPFNSLEDAFAEAAVQAQTAPVAISLLPGVYYTNGNLALPDDCSIVGTNGQYSTTIVMNDGFENNNCILVGSGCYVQGLAFSNLKIDNFDDPNGGFAVAFRPGAKILRSPYMRDLSQISNYNRQSIAAPLDPRNSLGGIEDLGGTDHPNSLVGRGGGVLLADRAILNQNSIFPYMLAFGATPRSPNGLGYVAKNGAGINGIGSITIFQRCAFYALNGGQITLNNSGTQFGDISMRAKGSTPVVDPYETNATLVVAPTLADAIRANLETIIDDMWDYLTTTQGYDPEDVNEEFTRRDAANLLTAIAFDVQVGSQTSTRNFVAGFFDYKGDHVFDINDANLVQAFIDSYDFMKDEIKALSAITAEEDMVEGLFEDVLKDTLLDPQRLQFGSLIESIGHQFNLAGAGVNKNALPLNFRRVGKPLAASGSVLQEDGGRVRWSGADELNNQYFARGLKINGRTGRLEGRPFTSSVRRLARRAANSRTSL
jgi:hypothetical protein